MLNKHMMERNWWNINQQELDNVKKINTRRMVISPSDLTYCLGSQYCRTDDSVKLPNIFSPSQFYNVWLAAHTVRWMKQ